MAQSFDASQRSLTTHQSGLSERQLYVKARLRTPTRAKRQGAGTLDDPSAAPERKLPGVLPEASRPLVHCFWDLDNKQVGSSDEVVNVVDLLKKSLAVYGELRTLRAFGNKHCFSWVPAEERRLRKARAKAEQQ